MRHLWPVLPLLAACAMPAPNPCQPGEQDARLDTLYFGTARRSAPPVTGAEWRDFLERVILPRFPDGLTWWEAQGTWRTMDGADQRETSHVLQLVHPTGVPVESALADIVRRYRRRFDQEAVLQVGVPACLAVPGAVSGNHL